VVGFYNWALEVGVWGGAVQALLGFFTSGDPLILTRRILQIIVGFLMTQLLTQVSVSDLLFQILFGLQKWRILRPAIETTCDLALSHGLLLTATPKQRRAIMKRRREKDHDHTQIDGQEIQTMLAGLNADTVRRFNRIENATAAAMAAQDASGAAAAMAAGGADRLRARQAAQDMMETAYQIDRDELQSYHNDKK
jgi:hypothetical protein